MIYRFTYEVTSNCNYKCNYLYLNRNLDYYNYNRVGDDGIHYYMKLIGLDDKINNLDLIGYSDIIKEKLLFNDNDLLLELIEGITCND